MNSKSPLKLAEVRAMIKKHDRKNLEFIIAQMYKMIPKDRKIDNDVNSLIENPEKFANKSKVSKKGKTMRPFNKVEKEVLFFEDNAYEQNYMVPNRSIKKADRPKWRFVVKRLYKELNEYAKQEEYIQKAADNLLKLYEVLTYACGYYLFRTYDAFESVGIEQTVFYRSIIEKYNETMERDAFISKSIDIMFDNYLNRNTLYSDLMILFLEYIQTPDMLYLTIDISEKKRQELVKNKKSTNYHYEYEVKEKLNNYTKLIFRCYARLYEFDNAIIDYQKNMIESSEEVKLYILVWLLLDYKQKDLILKIITEAEKKISLREGLIKMKNYILENDELPKYMF